MKKVSPREPYIGYFLLFLLFLSLFFGKFNSYFSNITVIILSMPAFFHSLSSLGFRNLKKGFLVGFISSLVFFPFIKVEDLATLFLINTIIFSFLEELFFRGYLFKIFQIRNIHLKNIFISILFSFAHVILYGNLFKITVFFPSLVFGYLYIYTGSIVAPFIFHIFSNLFYESFFQEKLISFINSL